jgi:hypothetical protein
MIIKWYSLSNKLLKIFSKSLINEDYKQKFFCKLFVSFLIILRKNKIQV